MNDTIFLLFIAVFLAGSFLVGMAIIVLARPILMWYINPRRMWRSGPNYCYDEARKLFYVEAAPDSMWLESKLGYVCDKEKGRVYVSPARVQVLMLRLTGVLFAGGSLLLALFLFRVGVFSFPV